MEDFQVDEELKGLIIEMEELHHGPPPMGAAW